MFNKEKIQALEQSVATLTEELNKANDEIKLLCDCLEAVKAEKIELENKYDAFMNAFENTYAPRIDRVIEEMGEKSGKDNSALRDEIKKVAGIVTKLEEKSNNADKEHDELLAVLKDNNDRLIKKCDELQLNNVQIMNEHKDMIKRYETNIKEYQTQTQVMKDNILKKMNAKNIISVVEE